MAYGSHHHKRQQNSDQVYADVTNGGRPPCDKALVVFIGSGVKQGQETPKRLSGQNREAMLGQGSPEQQGQDAKLHYVGHFAQEEIPDTPVGREAGLGRKIEYEQRPGSHSQPGDGGVPGCTTGFVRDTAQE
jgi:hypothetical protein